MIKIAPLNFIGLKTGKELLHFLETHKDGNSLYKKVYDDYLYEEELKKLQKDGASEDSIKEAEAKVQKLTDSYIAKVDEVLSKKEVEIMTV